MSEMEFEKDLQVTETGIEGLKVLELAVHGDPRGWFKENWQRAKMVALGVPDLRVVQNYAGAAGPVAPRPVHSALDLAKLEATGFRMPDWEQELKEYLASLLGQR